jgi:hypothetical protein
LLIFDGMVFPLTEVGVPEGTNAPWSDLFEAGGTYALSFAASWWWLAKANSLNPSITDELVEEFKNIALLQGHLPDESPISIPTPFTMGPLVPDRAVFDELVAKWGEDTSFESSSNKILEHEALAHIVMMGAGTIPWILESLDTEPFLCYALAEITKESVEHEPGDITGMVKAWKEWGTNRPMPEVEAVVETSP